MVKMGKLLVLFIGLCCLACQILACSNNPTLRVCAGYKSAGKEYLQPYVRTLQTLLRGKGYSLTVDGYFGPGTLSIVKQWQARAGLTVDGIVGRKTWGSLCGSTASSKPAPSCPAPKAICSGICRNCREVGNQFLQLSFLLRGLIRKRSYSGRLIKFYDLVKTNGAADFKNNIYKRDCCLRLFGKQVANDVPANIAYGFFGRPLFPDLVLYAGAGYIHANPNAGVKKAFVEVGVDVLRKAFKWNSYYGIKYPWFENTPRQAVKKSLEGWAAQDDPQDRRAIEIGIRFSRTLGGVSKVLTGRSRLDFVNRLIQGYAGLRKCC